MDEYDVVVIGLGPSGLSFCTDLFNEPKSKSLKICAIDAGVLLPNRSRYAVDVNEGIGGAGLFSDGKFSFFPSCSEIWNVSDKQRLSSAYNSLTNILKPYDKSNIIPSFPTLKEINELIDSNKHKQQERFYLKKYPTLHLTLDERIEMVSNIWNRLTSNSNFTPLLQTELVNIQKLTESHKNARNFLLEIQTTITPTTNNNETSNVIRRKILASKVVFCGGRFGPLFLNSQKSLGFETKIRRLEFGLRIVQPTSKAFFVDYQRENVKDPKFIRNDEENSLEWRTFCACRDGEMVFAKTRGIWAVSGRSDCVEPSRISNIGFTVRIWHSDLEAEELDDLFRRFSDSKCHFSMPIEQFMNEKNAFSVFGSLSKQLLIGLESWMNQFYFEKLQTQTSQLQTQTQTQTQQVEQHNDGEKLDSASDTNEKTSTNLNTKNFFSNISELKNDTQVVGPCLEGCYVYPVLNENFETIGCENLYVCGDSTGTIRGIVGSMLSGSYVASCIVDRIFENKM